MGAVVNAGPNLILWANQICLPMDFPVGSRRKQERCGLAANEGQGPFITGMRQG